MTTKPFHTLKPWDVLTKFADFTWITVVEPALTENSMARLGYTPSK